MTPASTAATGSAGPHFEAQVGAYYLLTLLAGGEPRGLPGTTITRVAFQQAAAGHPLDDVVVHTEDQHGVEAILEVQVKRTVDFTPSDDVFCDVVHQVAAAVTKPGFLQTQHELAVAIARTATKIERAYQEVLSWARSFTSAADFMRQLSQKNTANSDMRRFVEVFRKHLGSAGAPTDDEAVWKILRRFQILVFDFQAPGSASLTLVHERAAMLLLPEQGCRQRALWDTLAQRAMDLARDGGDRDRVTLQQDLHAYGYQFAPARSFAKARRRLRDVTMGALADIGDTVGSVHLPRVARVTEAREALNRGRYVEIRGAPGVGKSAVLKQLAVQMAHEAHVIVLDPPRVPGGGWLALSNQLDCDATAEEFLADLACDGAAYLFVDGIDQVEDPTGRATLSDLLRAAAQLKSFHVVATARDDFGRGSQMWLPEGPVRELGRIEVALDELGEAEIGDLADADPALARLLAEQHPARPVARNLFRLSCLLAITPAEATGKAWTEIDLAESWWNTGGGGDLLGRRDRIAALRKLAVQVLRSSGPLDIGDLSGQIIEALVKARTLRELVLGRTAVFYHDVLRDWAITCLMHEDPSCIALLPLDQPAPAHLIRGVELAARFALERTGDGTAWGQVVDRVSQPGAHGSWRRSALLAVPRSEAGISVMDKAAPRLLSSQGTELGELIRLVKAVETRPIRQALQAANFNAIPVPENLFIPSGASWPALLSWLLANMERVPKVLIPDLLDFFTVWMLLSVFWPGAPFSPALVQHIFFWLREFEAALRPDRCANLRAPFGVQFGRELELEADLRTAFLQFCWLMPELAEGYLRDLARRKNLLQQVWRVLEFPGTAARAAPGALVDLILAAADQVAHRRDRPARYGRVFDFVDSNFDPPSPSRGPFLELLRCSAPDGLRLVHQLVRHAAAPLRSEKPNDIDDVIIPFPTGRRRFPVNPSYHWARGNTGSALVASALMALEAWGHEQIEAGRPVAEVVGDVLGPEGTPAAVLLVAVDLMLSHWSKAKGMAWPYMASPELLALESTRGAADTTGVADRYKPAETKQPGVLGYDDLRARPSRCRQLDIQIGEFTIHGPAPALRQLCRTLKRELRRWQGLLAGQELRVGDDPRFSAVHALHLADRRNWSQAEEVRADGTVTKGYKYQPPPEELVFLNPAKKRSDGDFEDLTFRFLLERAFLDAKQSAPALVANGITWARSGKASSDPFDQEWRDRSIAIAATLAMRDGDDATLRENEAWARAVFTEAIADQRSAFQRQANAEVTHNILAIAVIGLIHLFRRLPGPSDRNTLLELAGCAEPAVAVAFGMEMLTLAQIDRRLPRALLRLGLAACIIPRHHFNDNPPLPAEAAPALQAERDWLDGLTVEPGWPAFPAGGDADAILADQDAAYWLQSVDALHDEIYLDWLRDLVATCTPWTAQANGKGHEEDVRPPFEWNHSFFSLMARLCPGLSPSALEGFAIKPITDLPDNGFSSAVGSFLPTYDALLFDAGTVTDPDAIAVRKAFVERLTRCWGWSRLCDTPSPSVPTSFAAALKVIYLHWPDSFGPPECYLLPAGTTRLHLFMPLLTELAQQASSSGFVARLFLQLVSVEAREELLSWLCEVMMSWLPTQGPMPSPLPTQPHQYRPHRGYGERICRWLDSLLRTDKALMLRHPEETRVIFEVLDQLIAHGVSQASALEEMMTCRQGCDQAAVSHARGQPDDAGGS